MSEVEKFLAEITEYVEQTVDLVLWPKEEPKPPQIVELPNGETMALATSFLGGAPGPHSGHDPHRVLEVHPKDDGLALYLVTQRRVNNRWAIDEGVTTSFVLTAEQVESLREYLNARAKEAA